MCGIAGVIHKGTKSNVGGELTAMLQSMKHRGPDSTGFALYHQDVTDNQYIMRFKVAEQEDLASGFDIHEAISQRKAAVGERLQELGANILKTEDATEYAQRYTFDFDGDLKRLIDYIEDSMPLKLSLSASRRSW
jgi:glutamate synthase domain-containing protein 1